MMTAASNFNVICLVRKKPSKLTLNVKGEGYAVHDSLQIEGADGRLVELSPDTPNHLDFGQVCCSPLGMSLHCVVVRHITSAELTGMFMTDYFGKTRHAMQEPSSS